ncbi:TetR/AcrR family transcriptional regulator [Sulfurimonas sp. HSL3-2]|uniref:TetR/AcrR family transcriptional regulator n=1 Tax=Hydrocurvibacter mobilis TaxID=3131936 RepID=UPI0031F8F7AB
MKNTKQTLIDITFDMLYKRGYCATGLMDILQSANLTKGAMYYHFKNKNELVLSAMQYYLEFLLESHWTTPLADSEQPLNTLIEQINALYDLYASDDAFVTVKHGCPLNNFIQDMSDKEEEFFQYLQSVYSRWQEAMEMALFKAQNLKQTKTKFKPKEQALFIVSAIEGSICSAKANNDLNTLKISFNVLNQYIKSL